MFTPSRLALARKRRGYTITGLAKEIGVTPQSISNAERGRQEPSDSTLLSISSALRFPVSFFQRDEPVDITAEQVSFRARSRTSARARNAALSAAVLATELHGWLESRFDLPVTDVPTLEQPYTAEMAASYVRAAWGVSPDAGISNVVHLLEAHGIAIYSLPPGYRDVDAFSFWMDGTPFVLLNTVKSGERGRFDAAHELGHLVLHQCDSGQVRSREEEKEADAFAAAFLMPTAGIKRLFQQSPSVDEIIRKKKRYRVSAMALAYRLRELDILTEWGHRNAVIDLGRMGFRGGEPQGISRESSRVIQQAIAWLRSMNISLREISKDLDFDPSELNELMFNLAVLPVTVSNRERIRAKQSELDNNPDRDNGIRHLHAIPGQDASSAG